MTAPTQPDRCLILQTNGGWAEDAMLKRCTFPIGPWNTYSNGAYFLAALALVARNKAPATLVMATALLALAVGSALYHGFKTSFCNKLDWVGMYLVFGALSVHGIAPDNPQTPAFMAVTGIALATLFSYVIPKVTLDIQVGLLFWFSAIPIAIAGHWPLVLAALGLFCVAFGCQVLDRKKVIGRYGHATWHCLTAIGIALLFIGQG